MSSDADLSPAERDALHAYARRHGRTWKSSLRDDWMRGRAEGPLQRIRNRLGPRWLAAYRVTRVNPARPKKADCSRAGKNLATRKSTRAGRALQACAPRDNPLPKGQSVWSVLYRDGDSGEALYAQVFATSAADARHAFHTMTQDAAHRVSRVVRGAPSPELREGRTFAGRFSNPDNVRDNPSPHAERREGHRGQDRLVDRARRDLSTPLPASASGRRARLDRGLPPRSPRGLRLEAGTRARDVGGADPSRRRPRGPRGLRRPPRLGLVSAWHPRRTR
jgi:hypothetical protein